MTRPDLAAAHDVADRAWAWVLRQVHHDDDGPWIPVTVPAQGEPEPDAKYRNSWYDGIAGLAPALAEIRLARPWTEQEQRLADALVAALREADPLDSALHNGTAGFLVAAGLLDGPGSDALAERLAAARTSDGWLTPELGDGASPVNDVILGDAGVLLACLWSGDPRLDEALALGADALAARGREEPDGLSWKMFEGDRDRVMPNFSHGTAGTATALALAGQRLGRPDLVDAARRGAEHLVHLADTAEGRFRLPLQIPAPEGDLEPFSYGWCHGPTGSLLMFEALRYAGVAEVSGVACDEWTRRARRTVRESGLPDRLWPGFWDNDGRCCGTAGVLDSELDAWQATRDPQAAEFADRLAAALVERALPDPDDADLRRWQFVEHRAEVPLLDPGVGWMAGAAGIAAALHRYVRVREQGPDADVLRLPESWWVTV